MNMTVMYEYDTMEFDCSELLKSSKFDIDRHTKSSEVVAVLVELYNITYCSAPDGFYSEDEEEDKVSNKCVFQRRSAIKGPFLNGNLWLIK